MLHKPENIVNLESGAVIAAEVRCGDAGDTEDLSTRVIQAVELVKEMYGQDVDGPSCVLDITGDKGFHHPAELAILQEEPGARTIIGDPTPPAVSPPIWSLRPGGRWTRPPAP